MRDRKMHLLAYVKTGPTAQLASRIATPTKIESRVLIRIGTSALANPGSREF